MNAGRQPTNDTNPGRVKVGVAEFGVASGDTVLTTSGLGSCVGVALADPTANVAGLAHVMLPETTDGRGKPAKTVEGGVEQLVAAVESSGGDLDRVEAKIAGGSRMFDFSSVGEAVGERNVERTRESLTDRDIEIVAEDVGGDYGRSIEVHPRAWTLTVTSAHEGVVEL